LAKVEGKAAKKPPERGTLTKTPAEPVLISVSQLQPLRDQLHRTKGVNLDLNPWEALFDAALVRTLT